MRLLLRISAAVCNALYRYLAAFGPVGTPGRMGALDYGATWYSHHMELSHVEGEVPVSGELEVSSEVYYTLTHSAVIPIELGRGRLGLLWYRSINGVPVEE